MLYQQRYGVPPYWSEWKPSPAQEAAKRAAENAEKEVEEKKRKTEQ